MQRQSWFRSFLAGSFCVTLPVKQKLSSFQPYVKIKANLVRFFFFL